MKNRLLVGWVFAAVTLLAYAPMAHAVLYYGDPAPDFTLPTSAGGTFRLSDNFGTSGKIVVLDIWASWCGPCRQEIPYLVGINNDYSGSGVVVVGVALDSPSSEAIAYAASVGVNYTICLDPNAAVVGDPYDVYYIPSTYIIDKTGIIRYAGEGFYYTDAEQMRSVIESLLDPAFISVTDTYPRSGLSGEAWCYVWLDGAGLQSDMSVKLRKSGQEDISASFVYAYDTTEALCWFDLTNRTAGVWDVVATNLSGRSSTLPGAFTITTPIGQVKKLNNGDHAWIGGTVIGGFSGYAYLEADNRSAGIRVQTSSGLAEGDRVAFYGQVGTLDGERTISADPIPVESNYEPLPYPIGLSARNFGGAAVGVAGVDTTGMAATIWGKVTAIGPGYLYLDDGSGVKDGTLTEAIENLGVRVVCDPTGYGENDSLCVTGVSSYFKTPAGLIARRLITRPGDVIQVLRRAP